MISTISVLIRDKLLFLIPTTKMRTIFRYIYWMHLEIQYLQSPSNMKLIQWSCIFVVILRRNSTTQLLLNWVEVCDSSIWCHGSNGQQKRDVAKENIWKTWIIKDLTIQNKVLTLKMEMKKMKSRICRYFSKMPSTYKIRMIS